MRVMCHLLPLAAIRGILLPGRRLVIPSASFTDVNYFLKGFFFFVALLSKYPFYHCQKRQQQSVLVSCSHTVMRSWLRSPHELPAHLLVDSLALPAFVGFPQFSHLSFVLSFMLVQYLCFERIKSSQVTSMHLAPEPVPAATGVRPQ